MKYMSNSKHYYNKKTYIKNFKNIVKFIEKISEFAGIRYCNLVNINIKIQLNKSIISI